MTDLMHALYITGMHADVADNRVVAARRLYNVSRAMDPAISAEVVESHAEAAHLLEVLRDAGVVLVAMVGADEYDALTEFKDRLREQGFAAAIDPDVERLTTQHASRKMTAEGATPEQVFKQLAPGPQPAPEDDATALSRTPYGRAITVEGYRTALALLPALDGNPVQAASLACNLSRTTGQGEVYQAAVDAIIEVFPWVKQPLIDNGLITPNPPADEA